MSISAGQSFTGLRSFHRWSGLLVWLSLQPQLYAQDQVQTPLQTPVQARIQTPEEGLSFSFQDIEVRAVLQLLAEDHQEWVRPQGIADLGMRSDDGDGSSRDNGSGRRFIRRGDA